MTLTTKEITALALHLPDSQPYSDNLLRAQEELVALAKERDTLRELLREAREWNWIDFDDDMEADPEDTKLQHRGLCDLDEKINTILNP